MHLCYRTLNTHPPCPLSSCDPTGNPRHCRDAFVWLNFNTEHQNEKRRSRSGRQAFHPICHNRHRAFGTEGTGVENLINVQKINRPLVRVLPLGKWARRRRSCPATWCVFILLLCGLQEGMLAGLVWILLWYFSTHTSTRSTSQDREFVFLLALVWSPFLSVDQLDWSGTFMQKTNGSKSYLKPSSASSSSLPLCCKQLLQFVAHYNFCHRVWTIFK